MAAAAGGAVSPQHVSLVATITARGADPWVDADLDPVLVPIICDIITATPDESITLK